MIHVACIADGGYLRHTAAMLHSALTSSRGDLFTIYLLHGSEIGEEDRSRLQQVTDAFGARLRLMKVDSAVAATFPSGYFPSSVWFRVLLPDLLPELDRVLYLDSDLIVTDDLQGLWKTDLGDHLLGAVTNPFYPFMPPYPRLRWGIERPEDYFNSGVLLLNLAQMRDENIAARLQDFARSQHGCSYPDQDALNVVCRDRWLRLHPRWNTQSTFFELPREQLPAPAEQVAEAVAHPAVVHFIGPFKPWQYLCRHPLRHLYFEHARATPWGEPPIEGRTLRNALLRRLPLAWIDRWLALERRIGRKWQRVASRLRAAPG